MNAAPTLSVVVATYQRLSRLQRCIAAIRTNVTISHELVIVGGGTDGTPEWLGGQTDIRYIAETVREGATRAYNKGFQAAKGEFVCWLNDDAFPLPSALEAAIVQLQRSESAGVGMIAMYHNDPRKWNRLDSIEHADETFSIYNVRGVPYANFGLLRTSLLRQLNYLDERYYFCAWDPDLSLKVQREAGLKVVGCPTSLIYHEELIDERKSDDLRTVVEDDNRKLFAKWQLPEKFAYPDPIPAYQKLKAELHFA